MITIDEGLSHKLANVGFLCACMVVARHVHIVFKNGSNLLMAIFDIAVPMFFIISGFLLAGHFDERQWWLRAIKKRLRSLAVPYAFWNLFYLAVSCALTFVASLVGAEFGGELWSNIGCGRILRAIGVDFQMFPELSYLWFVRCLIVFSAISPVFLCVKSLTMGGVVLFVEFAIYCMLPMLIPSSVDWQARFLNMAWVRGVLLFSAGIYLRWNGERFAGIFRFCPRCIGFLIGLGLCGCCVCFGYDQVHRLLCVPLLMIGLWNLVSSHQWPQWLTSSAFSVYLLHHFILIMFVGVCRFAVVKQVLQMSIMVYVLQVFVLVFVCIGIRLLLRKYCIGVASIVFGGR